MKVQSLSICIPLKNCVNNCKFCVSKLHKNDYKYVGSNMIDSFISRLQYTRDQGCDVVVLTGLGEVLQNYKFLQDFIIMNNEIREPYEKIELQTTGVMLEKNLTMLDGFIKTISLSVADIFDNDNNLKIEGVPNNLKFNLNDLCKKIINHGFNLRLSLNMLNHYKNKTTKEILDRCKELGANQVTFREMYFSKNSFSIKEKEINDWIIKNKLPFKKFLSKKLTINKIINFIKKNGNPLYKLPFGSVLYSYNEMSIVIDDDCMNKKKYKDSLKYYILREDCKLYTRWDDKGSLIF